MRRLSARRVVLVSHDIGGMVAYAYARQFPDDLAGAVILDVPLLGIAPWNEVEKMSQAWHFDFNAQRPLAEQLVEGRQARDFRYFIDHISNDTGRVEAVSDADIAGYAAAYGSADQLSAGFGFYRAFVQDKVFNDGQRKVLVVPLLIAGADRSLCKGAAVTAKALREHGASEVQSTVIEGSGHWVAEEQPAAVAALIDRFVTATGKPR